MSHFSTLRKITDAEILKVLRDLGITAKRADVRGYNGQRLRADLVAVLGEYDLGWSRNSDGSFDSLTSGALLEA